MHNMKIIDQRSLRFVYMSLRLRKRILREKNKENELEFWGSDHAMELEEVLAGKDHDHHTRDHVICHQHPLSIPTLRSPAPTNQPTPCS